MSVIHLIFLLVQVWLDLGIVHFADAKHCAVEFKDVDEKHKIFQLASECYETHPLITREEGELDKDGKIINLEKQFFLDNANNCAQKCIADGLQQTFPNGTLDMGKVDEAYNKLNATCRYREKAIKITKDCKTAADGEDIRPNNMETLCKYHMQIFKCLGDKFGEFKHELDALSCVQEQVNQPEPES